MERYGNDWRTARLEIRALALVELNTGEIPSSGGKGIGYIANPHGEKKIKLIKVKLM